MKPTMPIMPHYLRAVSTGRPAKVDREAKALRGYVIAQEGVFKDSRGAFNAQSLSEIVRVGNAVRGGLRSHFTHANLSGDGLGKFLGRSRNFAMSTTTDGDGRTVKAVRGDLLFDETAFKTPSGDLATYVMDLTESDPDAISSSLVILPRQEDQLDDRGRLKLDADGEPLPPLWFPEKLKASDIVSEGAAVDGLLSVQDMDPDDFVNLASQGLDHLFRDQPREVIEARVTAYLGRYLERRFPGAVPAAGAVAPVPTPLLDGYSIRLQEMGLAVAKMKGVK
jgi:hypothetical protein